MIVCSPREVVLAWVWTRAMCHGLLGPTEGERFARSLGVVSVMRLWGTLQVAEA